MQALYSKAWWWSSSRYCDSHRKYVEQKDATSTTHLQSGRTQLARGVRASLQMWNKNRSQEQEDSSQQLLNKERTWCHYLSHQSNCKASTCMNVWMMLLIWVETGCMCCHLSPTHKGQIQITLECQQKWNRWRSVIRQKMEEMEKNEGWFKKCVVVNGSSWSTEKAFLRDSGAELDVFIGTRNEALTQTVI